MAILETQKRVLRRLGRRAHLVLAARRKEEQK